MSTLESRSLQKLLQLVPLRTLDDFLERHEVGRDPPDPAVEQIEATRVACGVLHVDGKDSQPERSFRQIGHHLGVSGHTARNLVDRAQAELRRLIG